MEAAMLAHDSILRHLPARVQLETRLRFEALVFAADVLTFAFCSIRDITARYGAGISSISLHDRIALFTHAWTMVDQIHILRQLIKTTTTSGQMGPNQKSFYDTYVTAWSMRNKMDHLTGMFQNLASRKGIHPPFFGAISYFLVEADQMVQTPAGAIVHAGTVITVSAGSVQGDKTLIPMPNPAARPIHPPTSQFMLAAFDLELNLEEAVKALQAILNKASEQIGEDLKRQCEAESARSGTSANDFMAEPPFVDLVLEFGFKFGPHPNSGEGVPQPKKE
jgi:hypothetical protein